MYCDECKTKPAGVHITQLFNGKQVELHLCQECAAKKGVAMFNLADAMSLPKILGSFFGVGPNVCGPAVYTPEAMCSNCGTSFDGIGQQGRLGCSHCYDMYQDQMEPILRRIHGNSQHTGKIPQRSAGKIKVKRQIDLLKGDLQNAVAMEQYESAAELRDSIKKLERELELGAGQ